MLRAKIQWRRQAFDIHRGDATPPGALPARENCLLSFDGSDRTQVPAGESDLRACERRNFLLGCRYFAS
jgi:hypothetical protein